jgi:glycosyltransferase involved in cell wall biosynthesis
MDICSVITSFTTGGAEMLVCNLSRNFVAAGHQASVVALSHAEAVGNSADSEKEIVARLRENGVDATILGLDGRRSMLKGRRALGRYLDEKRPDVLHLHTARATLMAGLSGTNIPLILTHHNSRLSFSRHLYKVFDQFVFAYVGISPTCASQTRRHARRPVRLILNGAESSRAAGVPRTAPGERPTIIAVGTISDQKDYPALVAAAKCLVPLLAAEDREFTVQIIGGGEGLSGLEDLVRTEGLDGKIDLLGVRSDVPDLLKAADLFVNSSRYEGLSVATIEALMTGLPIVATDVPGNRDIVHESENGFLVGGGDPAAFAGAIAKVLSDDKLYSQLSSGALNSSKNFTLERCAEEHLGLYEEAVASRGAGRHAA